MENMDNQVFISCSLGFEDALSNELKRLAPDSPVTPDKGGVILKTNQENLYRILQRSQIASRALVQLRSFAAHHPPMLYSQTRRLDWEKLIGPHRTFAVDCVLSKSSDHRWQDPNAPRSTLNNSLGTALKIKDAICDRIRTECNDVRPDVDRESPDVRVHAYVKDGKCQLSLDASGFSLHERGYRVAQGEAPLKENLAAACLEYTGWTPDQVLYDPFCGSGTFLIEAALKATETLHHLPNRRYGVKHWPDFNSVVWDRVAREVRGYKPEEKPKLKLFGSDQSRHMTTLTSRNAERARVLEYLTITTQDFFNTKPPTDTPGIILMNPPYGERMEANADFFKRVGDHLKHNYKGWNVWMLLGSKESLKQIGLRTAKRIPIFNGPIECRLVKFELY